MTINYEQRNKVVLDDFVEYCQRNPGLRFWQALCGWAGFNFILVAELPPTEISKKGNLRDTFYWEGRNG